MGDQISVILKNPLFLFLALGYASYAFTIGGLGFWAITFVEGYYDVSPTTATMSVGGISLITGLGSAILGSFIADRMLAPYVKAREEDLIDDTKLNWYKAEVSAKVAFWSMFIGMFFAIAGAASQNFLAFCVLIFFSEGFIFMGTGPIAMALMSSCDEHLRGMVNACSNFILHLLGDVPSPYVIGVFVQYIGYFFAIMFLSCWLVWASFFWWLAVAMA